MAGAGGGNGGAGGGKLVDMYRYYKNATRMVSLMLFVIVEIVNGKWQVARAGVVMLSVCCCCVCSPQTLVC